MELLTPIVRPGLGILLLTSLPGLGGRATRSGSWSCMCVISLVILTTPLPDLLDDAIDHPANNSALRFRGRGPIPFLDPSTALTLRRIAEPSAGNTYLTNNHGPLLVDAEGPTRSPV